jgi:hypothetical protein
MTIKGLFDLDLNFDPIEVANIPSTDATALIQIVNDAPLLSTSFEHVESGGMVAGLVELRVILPW